MGSDSRESVAPGVVLPASTLAWTFSRGGGPGGQNVNKVNSRATLTVTLADLSAHMPRGAVRRLRKLAGQKLAADPDRLVISSDASRSQHANRKACLQKLRTLLVQAMHRPKRRRKTRPSRGSVERRLDHKKRRGQRKAERSRTWRSGD